MAKVANFVCARARLKDEDEDDDSSKRKESKAESTRAKDATQFIVISLKSSLYEKADSLVGIYRDPLEATSKVLTLDLKQYA